MELTSSSIAAVLGRAGESIVSVCLLLFAFSSVLGWSYYGETALNWFVRGKSVRPIWRAVFLCVTVAGSVVEVGFVWQLVDLFTALMALPNLGALLVLSPQVLDSLNEYLKSQKHSVR